MRQPMPHKYEELARYNRDRHNGIQHTAETDARMSRLQHEFDEWAATVCHTDTISIIPVGTYVHIDAGTLNLKRLRRQDRRRRLLNRLLRRPNHNNDFQVLDINNVSTDGDIHITMRQDTKP